MSVQCITQFLSKPLTNVYPRIEGQKRGKPKCTTVMRQFYVPWFKKQGRWSNDDTELKTYILRTSSGQKLKLYSPTFRIKNGYTWTDKCSNHPSQKLIYKMFQRQGQNTTNYTFSLYLCLFVCSYFVFYMFFVNILSPAKQSSSSHFHSLTWLSSYKYMHFISGFLYQGCELVFFKSMVHGIKLDCSQLRAANVLTIQLYPLLNQVSYQFFTSILTISSSLLKL